MNTATNMMMPMQMGSMPMGMQSGMPMATMMPMMCHMDCSMTADGMMCVMKPAEGTTMEMLEACCGMMTSMMACGTPCGMMCGNMPMMACCGMPMMPAMECSMQGNGMVCMMKPMGMMGMDMMKMCCDTMNRMMDCGMPMTMMCGNMPMMVCMR